MTPDKQVLIDFLATEVLGWDGPLNDEPYPFEWVYYEDTKTGEKIAKYGKEGFNPLESPADTLRVLDAFEYYELRKSLSGEYFCKVPSYGEAWPTYAEHADFGTAVCLAAARAHGWAG